MATTTTEYRSGHIMTAANGTYSASYLNTATDRPYQALAGQGYGFESIEAAQAAIDAAIAALESPVMRLSWDGGEHYHGWSVSGQDMHRCPALKRLAYYMEGWGYTMHESTAEALGPVTTNTAGVRVIEFEAADVDRVAALVEAARVARATAARLVRCACGHTVTTGQVMSASLGTSCPDCYDRMSDGQQEG